MFKNLYPDEWVSSAYSIDYEKMYKEGKRGIIYDIDNTLVPHGAPADIYAKALFLRLNDMGYKIMLLSNNKEPRVRSFCDDVVGASYIFKAGKPMKKGYLKAMEDMGVKVEETVLIGDQLFTDVWGANRCGIHTILVDQIDKKEEIQIILKRRLEHIVLFFYKLHLKRMKIRGYLIPKIRGLNGNK